MSRDKIDVLLKWFKDNRGTIHPSLSLECTESDGYHFRAAKDIPPSTRPSGTAVCHCFLQLTLSHLNILSPAPAGVASFAADSVAAKLVGKVSPRSLGYVFLAEQRLKGKESFWAPYIDTLPAESDMCTPPWFEKEDLKWLLGTTMHSSEEPGKSAVEERKRMWRGEFADVINAFEEAAVDPRSYSW